MLVFTNSSWMLHALRELIRELDPLTKEATMVAADSFEHILLYLKETYSKKGTWMCGLLFAPPKTPIGKSIFERIADWHYRSGKNFDFFCVGYGNWNKDGQGKLVAS